MTTYMTSANSQCRDDRCNRATLYEKVWDRRAVRTMAGRTSGKAIHGGIAGYFKGESLAAQDAAIDAVLAAEPTPIDDYRQASFVKDALAAWRVERGALLKGWMIEEVEAHGEVELGHIIFGPERAPCTVLYEFRRDLVAVSPEGLRYVWDWKTSSRNEQAEIEASKNSGALMGYCWSYTKQTGLPVHGAYLGRIIMRKPTKNGIAFEFPSDGPIYFPQDRLAEWHRQALVKVRRILERDPQNLDDWPLASHVNGACRGVWGTCDFLSVCQLPLADRALRLSMDDFESASAAKQRDRAAAAPQTTAAAKEDA